MKKKGIVFAVSLALLPVIAQPSVVLAKEVDSTNNSYVEISVSDLKSTFPVTTLENSSDLPQNKKIELDKLAKDANLSNDEVQFLKEQYLKYHPTNQLETSKWKASLIKKAIALVKKAAVTAGIKLGETKIADFFDILYGYQGDMENALIKQFRKWGFSKKAAGILARSIMFVLF